MLAGTPWSEDYELTDEATGDPFDLTLYTLLFEARATPGGTLYGTLTESNRVNAAGTFTMTMAAATSLAVQTAGLYEFHVDGWAYLTADHTVRFPIAANVFTIERTYTTIP